MQWNGWTSVFVCNYTPLTCVLADIWNRVEILGTSPFLLSLEKYSQPGTWHVNWAHTLTVSPGHAVRSRVGRKVLKLEY